MLVKAVVYISSETQLRIANCYAWQAHRARGGGQADVVRMSRNVSTRVRAWRRQRWARPRGGPARAQVPRCEPVGNARTGGTISDVMSVGK